MRFTNQVYPSDPSLNPSGIEVRFFVNNLSVTQTQGGAYNLNCGCNTPLKTFSFPNFVIPQQSLQRLQDFKSKVQGKEQVFWYRDPSDCILYSRPEFTPFNSFTHGVLAFENGVGMFHQIYGIEVSRGFKIFYRAIAKIDTTQPVEIGGLDHVFSGTNGNASGVWDTEENFVFGDYPAGVSYADYGPPSARTLFEVEANFLVPVHFDRDRLDYRLISPQGPHSLYEFSGFTLTEVPLPVAGNIKAGWGRYSAQPSAVNGFSPIEDILTPPPIEDILTPPT